MVPTPGGSDKGEELLLHGGSLVPGAGLQFPKHPSWGKTLLILWPEGVRSAFELFLTLLTVPGFGFT